MKSIFDCLSYIGGLFAICLMLAIIFVTVSAVRELRKRSQDPTVDSVWDDME